MRQIRLIIAGLFLLSPFAAVAVPIVWTIDSSTSGSQVGGFTFDADTGTYTGVDVTGCCVEDYDVDNTAATIDAAFTNSGQLTLLGYIYPDALLMIWDSLLTNAGGVVQATWYELLNYNNGGHLDEQVSSTNYTLTGTMQLSAQGVSVPEPGTLALLGIGLFGMGLARRKKA